MNTIRAGAAALIAFGMTALGGGAQAQSCPATSAGNLVCIGQVGDGNYASVDQRDAVTSRATLSIHGNSNGAGSQAAGPVSLRAFSVSSGDANSDGEVNDADSTVTGQTPASSISGGRIVQSGAGHRATVEITGDSNIFEITQSGTGATATQTLLGNGNAAAIHQTGGVGNFASQRQEGATNYAWARQAGSSNFADLRQTGSSNTIQLDQQGGNNSANLSQNGDGHQIALYQPGSVSATINQSGAPKSIGVTQSGGPSAMTITQSGP